MQRSRINRALREAQAMCDRYLWRLPEWASWSPADHAANRAQSDWLGERQIGWDVTDYGRGDYDRMGLALLCVRNGIQGDPDEVPYAEKLLFVGQDQEAPFHAHKVKLEDIIVRGGGTLVVEFTAEGSFATPDAVRIDGRLTDWRRGPVKLRAGSGVTIPRGLQHRFWGEGAPVFVAEVSQCNDDKNDNFFLDHVPRFSQIEEDEPAWRPLWSDGRV